MGDYGFDGMIRVSFVPTLTAPNAPTVTQVSAGTPLEARLTADGLTITVETADVDTSKLNSTGNSGTIGRDSYTVAVKYVRGDQPEATAVQSTLVRGAAGYLVVRRDKLATVAWAATDKVELYPVICKAPAPDAPAANALQTVAVPMAVTDANGVRGIANQVALV